MKNIKLLILTSLLLVVGNYGFCDKAPVVSDKNSNSSKCVKACTDLQNIYADALNFFENGDAAALQAKLDKLSFVDENLSKNDLQNVDGFIVAVKNVIATEGKSISQEEQDDLIAKLKEAYIGVSKRLCE